MWGIMKMEITGDVAEAYDNSPETTIPLDIGDNDDIVMGDKATAMILICLLRQQEILKDFILITSDNWLGGDDTKKRYINGSILD
ncbi:hypothetical protein L2E82_46326 [Cichorium intybus]|uniref:Uncharacterized protein n=1 Tax=Cichorium intybus TaxID=13427 RepID=A0ACB8YTQ2_CICIN|nr:hypothetical protein L2E82_46326 [Cichorium intybus]